MSGSIVSTMASCTIRSGGVALAMGVGALAASEPELQAPTVSTTANANARP